MRRRGVLLMVLLMVLMLPVSAQKITVEQFKKVKKDLLNGTPLSKDKKQATLDLLTDEKGFEFKASGTVDVQVTEGDGMITILTPHKTKFLLIKHPEYGQTTWKVPDRKGLKKKKHYQANLVTDKPGKEYKMSKQWVVFKVTPQNAILVVDSTTALLRDGQAQFNLTVGKHPYKVDAPFHEAVEDTVEVVDSVKLFVPVVLQSFYSYLTVKQPMMDAFIFLDGQLIGRGGSTSGHLHTGDHRLQVYRNGECFLDSVFNIEKAEKKVIELAASDLRKKPHVAKLAVAAVAEEKAKPDSVAVGDLAVKDSVAVKDSLASQNNQAPQFAQVTITAPDDSTEIWVNREKMGEGKWEGQLQLGYYTVNTRKEGLESKTIPLWVDDTLPKILDLSAPQASYGLLNVHSNVIGAKVKVNGVEVGQTPCVVENLPASKSCTILLTKKGYVNAQAVMVPIGNDMLDVYLKMEKK